VRAVPLVPWSSYECVSESVTYYDKLVLISFVPLAFIAVLSGIPAVALYCIDRFDHSDVNTRRLERALARKKLLRLVLFAVFLLYPNVSSTLFSYFQCSTVNGATFLVVDFRVICYDARWQQYLPLAIVCIALYPIGVPLLVLYLLRSVRNRLNAPENQLALGFLYAAFSAEVPNIIRTVALSSPLWSVCVGVCVGPGRSFSDLIVCFACAGAVLRLRCVVWVCGVVSAVVCSITIGSCASWLTNW
jgi:hypothetical protein